VGVDEEVPVASGARVPYVNFDNAASTPPLRVVRDRVERFLDWYASVHRGTGFKSRLSTAAHEDSRSVIADFVSADPTLDRVSAIASGRIGLEYKQHPRTGDLEPVGWTPGWSNAFSIRG